MDHAQVSLLASHARSPFPFFRPTLPPLCVTSPPALPCTVQNAFPPALYLVVPPPPAAAAAPDGHSLENRPNHGQPPDEAHHPKPETTPSLRQGRVWCLLVRSASSSKTWPRVQVASAAREAGQFPQARPSSLHKLPRRRPTEPSASRRAPVFSNMPPRTSQFCNRARGSLSTASSQTIPAIPVARPP